jgi:dienelactone hydrolase
MRLILVLFLSAAAGLQDPEGLRQKVKDALFVPNPLPGLDTKTYQPVEIEPGIVADKVTYATEFGMRVPAVVYHPKDVTTKRPALIVVNGHGGDKYTWYAFYASVLYARAGGVVLTYDPAGEGERNRLRKDGSRQHDINQSPDEMGARMGGLMMTDIEQAVSYLRTRPDVDASRIGLTGYSMGSFVVSLACAVETRVHACAAVGGGFLDGPGGYWDSSSKKMCQALPYKALSFLGDRGAVLFSLSALRGPALIHNGATDDVVAIETRGPAFFQDMQNRTIAMLGSMKNVFTYSWTPDGGHRPYFVTRPVGEWLNEQLHFPNWQAVANDETHISEWANALGVPMDKLYATEHREGGTIALGKNIPYLKHDLLNVVPDEEWKKDQDKFVLETWWERARGK